KRWIILGLNK
nr:Chain C, HIV PEPTIDE [Human immunodeficiency virus]4G8G_C Chain C, P24 [Human immunodeficiency virus 1]4G9D_C Chain C, P24 [Human immunodeficiency virus 1]6PYL_C Chain C, Self-peptide LRN [Human immunodeficiency virus 1]